MSYLSLALPSCRVVHLYSRGFAIFIDVTIVPFVSISGGKYFTLVLLVSITLTAVVPGCLLKKSA